MLLKLGFDLSTTIKVRFTNILKAFKPLLLFLLISLCHESFYGIRLQFHVRIGLLRILPATDIDIDSSINAFPINVNDINIVGIMTARADLPWPFPN